MAHAFVVRGEVFPSKRALLDRIRAAIARGIDHQDGLFLREAFARYYFEGARPDLATAIAVRPTPTGGVVFELPGGETFCPSIRRFGPVRHRTRLAGHLRPAVAAYTRGHLRPACARCGAPGAEVDHVDPTFAAIVDGWLAGVDPSAIASGYDSPSGAVSLRLGGSVDILPSWVAYHASRAVLQTLCVACHAEKTRA